MVKKKSAAHAYEEDEEPAQGQWSREKGLFKGKLEYSGIGWGVTGVNLEEQDFFSNWFLAD